MREKPIKKEYVMAVLAVILWSTASPVCKLILGDIPAMQMLFLTSLESTVFLALTAIAGGRQKIIRSFRAKDYGILILLAITGTFLYNLFYLIGIDRLSAQEACIINYLWPMMIVLFSWPVLHEKLTARGVTALIISFAGIIIMVTRFDLRVLYSGSFTGVLACLAAAVCYGAFSALNKKYQYDQYVAMTIYSLVTTVLSGIMLIVSPHTLPVLNGGTVTGLLWMGVVVDGIGYLLWCHALLRGETAGISNIAYLTPFLTILAAKLLINEAVSIYSFIGLGFILAGILLQFRRAPEL